MKSTYELLIPIVAAIDKTFTIASVVDNGVDPVLTPLHTYTLGACNTLWALQKFPVTIQGNSYTIESIVPNVSITVSGTVLPTKGTFQLYPPIFYHGTVKAITTELEKDINNALLSWDRLPMIWLHEPTDERISEDELEAILLRSQLELYFMCDSDFAAWTNDDHYTYAIKPMRNLRDAFMVALKKSTSVDDNLLETGSLKDFARWGVYMGKDGGEKTIFARPMSGSRYDIEVPFIRNNETCCP